MKTMKTVALRVTSVPVALGLSGTAFAEVELTAQARNADGERIRIMVSGESVNGDMPGRAPGLTGLARLSCGRGGSRETVIIKGSRARGVFDPPDLISCPIELFYDHVGDDACMPPILPTGAPAVDCRIITVNLCDTPPTIGADFDMDADCFPVAVFGETSGDRVKADLSVGHRVP